jgi:hypothetical protein
MKLFFYFCRVEKWQPNEVAELSLTMLLLYLNEANIYDEEINQKSNN